MKDLDTIYNKYEEIFDRKVLARNDTRNKQIKNRLKFFSVDDIISAFQNASKNDFLCGKSDKNTTFYATIDYFIRNDQNIEKWILDKTTEVKEYWVGNKKVTKEEYGGKQ